MMLTRPSNRVVLERGDNALGQFQIVLEPGSDIRHRPLGGPQSWHGVDCSDCNGGGRYVRASRRVAHSRVGGTGGLPPAALRGCFVSIPQAMYPTMRDLYPVFDLATGQP